MLLAQLITVVLGLEAGAQSTGAWRYWNLDLEASFGTLLAGSQLLLIGCLALFTSWRSRALPVWHRAYFACLGALFLFLALDELVMIHEWYDIGVLYVALGVFVVAATGLTVRRASLRGFRKHLLLVAGLAILALGGLVLDSIPPYAVRAVDPIIDYRVLVYLEEVLELFGGWLVLLAMLGQFDAARKVPGPPQSWGDRLFAALSALVVIMCLATASQIPFVQALPQLIRHSREYRLWATEGAVVYEDDLRIVAYRLERREDSISFAPYLSAASWHDFTGLGYSLHLVDQAAKQSIASYDEQESRRSPWRTFARSGFVPHRTRYRSWLELEIPPDAPANRAMWLVFTLWREDGDSYSRLPFISSDLPRLSDYQLILEELVIPPPPPPPPPPARASRGITGQIRQEPRPGSGGTACQRATWRDP